MDETPNTLREERQRNELESIKYWNRIAFQEIVVLKARIKVMEEETGIQTGGDKFETFTGDPWERDVVYGSRMAIFCFFMGFISGMIIMGVMTI